MTEQREIFAGHKPQTEMEHAIVAATELIYEAVLSAAQRDESDRTPMVIMNSIGNALFRAYVAFGITEQSAVAVLKKAAELIEAHSVIIPQRVN
jgi:hypothetical protein